jgi:two-component system, chemotaxis family, protein-glutamate methylesterase/glutaminase
MNGPAASVRRVLICEDSKTFAACLTRLLERDPELEVVGVCASAEEAIARLPTLKPDLVTMDLELPGMSGGEAIEQIMLVLPVPILVLSGQAEPGSDTALRALAAGALDAMPKRQLDVSDPDGRAARALRQRVKLLCRIKVIRHLRASLATPRVVLPSWVRPAAVVGVAASTGGPPALAVMLSGLPAAYPIPILVVQHMSAGFTESFARWLDGEIALPVRMALAGARPSPGVWVAPEGSHLVLTQGGRLALDDTTVESPHRPSGDMLLHSLAAHPGRDAVAVVLTGMGRDGAAGLRDVRQAGGLTIAQDEASSSVYGMPRAAAECGAELVLPLTEISARLRALHPVARAA